MGIMIFSQLRIQETWALEGTVQVTRLHNDNGGVKSQIHRAPTAPDHDSHLQYLMFQLLHIPKQVLLYTDLPSPS